ncbi:Uncharacterised protein [Mycoplasma putrefaciens]|nr:Uncharacterised protein [Mycoplasma putrefaciens]
MYLLTSDYSILKITIRQKNDNIETSIFNYAFLYSELSKDQFKAEKFDILKYIKAEFLKVKNPNSIEKSEMNEKLGGNPLRFVIVDID